MPLSETERKKCVETLLNAEREKKQAVQLSVTYPHITIEDSYAISTAVAQHKIKAGARLIGHKVGLTSKAMQASSQINEPDYGHLLDTMMIADGAKVPHSNYCVPRVEVELAFILGKPLKGPGIRLTAWRGSRTSSGRWACRSTPATSSSPGRLRASCSRTRATPCTGTSGPWAGSRCSSYRSPAHDCSRLSHPSHPEASREEARRRARENGDAPSLRQHGAIVRARAP